MAHRKTGNVYYDDDDFDDGFSDDDYWEEEDDYDEYDDTVSKPQTNGKNPPIVNQKKDSGKSVATSDKRVAQIKSNGSLPSQLENLQVAQQDNSDTGFQLDPGLKALCEKADASDSSLNGRQTLNLVVLGHVDAGKSTLMGRMLYETGVVGDREISKAQKEAKAIGKGSFAWAWMLDERPEERTRGVTVDVAMARFETPHKRVTLLDAPGHRDFVPNMISGASQADAALIIIDGSEGGFESGMSSANMANPLGGGQTREHVQLAQSLGIEQIAVVVTKLDTCVDSESRFNEIKDIMGDFIHTCGFKDPKKIQWTLAVGLTGDNMTAPPTSDSLQWFTGPTLIETIDKFECSKRVINAPLRLSVTEASAKGSKNVILSGKIHQGAIKSGTKVVLVPPLETGTVKSLSIGGANAASGIQFARAGDTVDVVVSVSDPLTIHAGSVMCSPSQPVQLAQKFTAQIAVLDIVIPLLHGQNVTLHAHTASDTGIISRIVSLIDEDTGKVTRERPRCLLKGQAAIVEIIPSHPMALATFQDCKALARVALRDAGRTLAVGRITHICP